MTTFPRRLCYWPGRQAGLGVIVDDTYGSQLPLLCPILSLNLFPASSSAPGPTSLPQDSSADSPYSSVSERGSRGSWDSATPPSYTLPVRRAHLAGGGRPVEVRAMEAERLFLPHLQLPGALPVPSGILGVVVRLARTTTPRIALGAGKDPGSRVDSRKGQPALSISIKH